jgi:DUF4097 and DUF4098 domain-containing protein YvlB
LFVAVIVLAAFAHADDWSKTYNLTGKPDLRVEAVDATVRIESWDRNNIEAHVTTRGWHIGNGDLEIVEHQQGEAVTIQLREPHHNHFSFSVDARHTELEIRMPRNARVDVHTSDGSVSAKGLAGDLNFVTGDGRLVLEDNDGNLHAHTSDGSIRVSGRFDVVDLKTSDGRVAFEARPGSHMQEPWHIHTSDGSIDLRIPADLAADIDLHTSDGHIITNIPIVVEGSFDKENLHGKINGGGNSLSVSTSDGSITLDKL